MNKTPEQTARDNIDIMLERSGLVIVDKTAIKWGLVQIATGSDKTFTAITCKRLADKNRHHTEWN
jgi:hypothetical protein